MQMSDLRSRLHRRWLAPSLATAIASIALVAGLAFHRWTSLAAAREVAQQATLRSALDDRGDGTAVACASEVDYAWALPAAVSMDKLAQSLQDSAHAFGATLNSVSGEPRPATPRGLATLGINISLRGSYPALKSTLAEGLSRFPTATLQQLHFKRSATGQLGVEDASVQVGFALRPAVAGASPCRLAPPDRDSLGSTW